MAVYTPAGLIYFLTIPTQIRLVLMYYLQMKRDLEGGRRRRDFHQLERTLQSSCSAVVVGGSDTTSDLAVRKDQSMPNKRQKRNVFNYTEITFLFMFCDYSSCDISSYIFVLISGLLFFRWFNSLAIGKNILIQIIFHLLTF